MTSYPLVCKRTASSAVVTLLSLVVVCMLLTPTLAVNKFDIVRQTTPTLGEPVDVLLDQTREVIFVCTDDSSMGGTGGNFLVLNATTLTLVASTSMGGGNGSPVSCAYSRNTGIPYVVAVTNTVPAKVVRISVQIPATPFVASSTAYPNAASTMVKAINGEMYKPGYIILGFNYNNARACFTWYDAGLNTFSSAAATCSNVFTSLHSITVEATLKNVLITGQAPPAPFNPPPGDPDHIVSPYRYRAIESYPFRYDGPILVWFYSITAAHWPLDETPSPLTDPVWDVDTVENAFPLNGTYVRGKVNWIKSGTLSRRIEWDLLAPEPVDKGHIYKTYGPVSAHVRAGTKTYYIENKATPGTAILAIYDDSAQNVTNSIDLHHSTYHQCKTDPATPMTPLQSSIYCISKKGITRFSTAGWQIITSCASLNNTGHTNGVYLIKHPKLDPQVPPSPLYCDFTTDSGTWMTLARFTQPGNINDYKTKAPATLAEYFNNGLWIEGSSDGYPLAAKKTVVDYEVESVDWRDWMVQGKRYELRQRCWKGTGLNDEFDIGFRFIYPGHVTQHVSGEPNFLNNSYDNAWRFESREVFRDTSGIAWDVAATDMYQFWLPTHANISNYGDGHEVLTGCRGHSWRPSTTDCSGQRGHAGIIGLESDLMDPAAGFMPQHGVNLAGTRDLVRVNQNPAKYGDSGDAMTCEYYIRPGKHDSYPPTCSRYHNLPSGIYYIRPHRKNDIMPVYCENTQEQGGWTLLTKFEGHKDGWSQEEYDYYFKNAGWITGGADGLLPPPLSPTWDPDLTTGGRIEGLDWSLFLDKGNTYRLRQQCQATGPNRDFDNSYEFTYNGNLFQKNSADIEERSWRLRRRNNMGTDTLAPVWSTLGDDVDIKRFILPARAQDGPFTQYLCGNGMQTDCFTGDEYGGSGIITDGGNRYGATDLPYVRSDAPHRDMLYIRASGGNWNGQTSDPQVCNYYIKHIPTSCAEAQRESPFSSDGVILFFNRTSVNSPPYLSFCEFSSGTPWTLLSRFDSSSGLANIPAQAYSDLFEENGWIHGRANNPVGPIGEAATFASGSDFRVESLDWLEQLKEGDPYRLRQRCEYRNSTNVNGFDISYDFVFNGRVSQDNSIAYMQGNFRTLTNRHILLLNRTLLSNTMDLPFYLPSAETLHYFWLPIPKSEVGNDPFLCGATFDTGESYQYEVGINQTGVCNTVNNTRVYGSAGIISTHSAFAAMTVMPNSGVYDDFGDTGIFPLDPYLAGKAGGELSCGYMYQEIEDVAEDCTGAKAMFGAVDGKYLLRTPVTKKVVPGFCDQTTDNGGWTMLSRFSQPRSIGQLSAERYSAYFNQTTSWMDGVSEGPPLTKTPQFDDYHIESHDWKDFLEPNKDYQLRQRCTKFQNETVRLDIRYDVRAGTFFHQSAGGQYWQLARRVVLEDTTGITHNVDPRDTMGFYVPTDPSYSPFVCGRDNFEYSNTCGGNATGNIHHSYRRRWGNAGVVVTKDAQAGYTTGFSFLPQTGSTLFKNMAENADIAHLSGYPQVYGETGHEMSCYYYARPLTVHESCQAWKTADPTAQNGVYLIRRPGDTISQYRYCEMDGVTPAKMWDLMAKFSQDNGGVTGISGAQYLNYFENNLWIEGVSDKPPVTPKPDYSGSPPVQIESLDWRKYLTDGSIYDLRTKCMRNDDNTDMLDMAFTFIYNGRVRQLATADEDKIDEKSWVLTDRRILAQNLALPMPWDVSRPNEVYRFWLPFTTPGGLFPSKMLTGCNGYEFSTSACDHGTVNKGRYGNSGIIGDRPDLKDIGFTFLPQVPRITTYGRDLARIYMNSTGGTIPIYGDKGTQMVCTLWTRDRTDLKFPRDCQAIKDATPAAVSGIYTVMLPGNTTYRNVYCDMSTDNGGWTLMAKFSQHQGIDLMPVGRYNNLFRDSPMWIEGGAEGAPLSDVPVYDDYHVESHDWREFLDKDNWYQLRQQCHYHGDEYPNPRIRRNILDIRWDFFHRGSVVQGVSETNVDRKSWILYNRHVYSAGGTTDNWMQPDLNATNTVERFWFPFDQASGTQAGNYHFSGCNGGDYTDTECDSATAAKRRFGNAGIMKQYGTSGKSSGLWVPHLDASGGTADIANGYGLSYYGNTGHQMVCKYWVRPRRFANVNETFPSSCDEILKSNPNAHSGMYLLDNMHASQTDLQYAYCDMEHLKGGWTLMAKFEQSATIQTYPLVDYTRLFNNPTQIWIEGARDSDLVSPLPLYDGGPTLKVESLKWDAVLSTGVQYQLRQRCAHDNNANVVDNLYYFTYPGFTTQNPNNVGGTIATQAWKLTSLSSFDNSAGIAWDAPDNEDMYFWPPFKSTVTGKVATQCNGYSVGDDSTCDITDTSARRYGNAGIMGASADNKDPGVWVPHLDIVPGGQDIARVAQSLGTFGTSGLRMQCTYWIREQPPTPIVTATTPTRTMGGVTTITGSNFGHASPLEIKIKGEPCTNPTWLSTTMATCVSPPGTGAGHNVSVSAGPLKGANYPLFTYQPPKAFTWKPYPSATTDVIIGDTITIYGENFGPTKPSSINLPYNPTAVTCLNPVWVNDGMITCTVGNDLQAMAELGVTVDGLSSYFYPKRYTIYNSGTTDKFNATFTITLDTATLITNSKLDSACRNIYVHRNDKTSVPHWIDPLPGCNNAATKIFIRFDTLKAGTSSCITVMTLHATSLPIAATDGALVFGDGWEGFDYAQDPNLEPGFSEYPLKGGNIFYEDMSTVLDGSGSLRVNQRVDAKEIYRWDQRGATLERTFPSLINAHIVSYFYDSLNSNCTTHVPLTRRNCALRPRCEMFSFTFNNTCTCARYNFTYEITNITKSGQTCANVTTLLSTLDIAPWVPAWVNNQTNHTAVCANHNFTASPSPVFTFQIEVNQTVEANNTMVPCMDWRCIGPNRNDTAPFKGLLPFGAPALREYQCDTCSCDNATVALSDPFAFSCVNKTCTNCDCNAYNLTGMVNNVLPLDCEYYDPPYNETNCDVWMSPGNPNNTRVGLLPEIANGTNDFYGFLYGPNVINTLPGWNNRTQHNCSTESYTVANATTGANMTCEFNDCPGLFQVYDPTGFGNNHTLYCNQTNNCTAICFENQCNITTCEPWYIYNATAGVFNTGLYATTIPRSLGWHKIEYRYDPGASKTEFYLDHVLQATYPYFPPAGKLQWGTGTISNTDSRFDATYTYQHHADIQVLSDCRSDTCRRLKNAFPGATTGLATVQYPGMKVPNTVLCDHAYDGGGWVVLSKFSQNANIVNLDNQTYFDYFYANHWAHGAAHQRPAALNPAYTQPVLHVESIDWRDIFAPGKAYEFRQQCGKGATAATDKVHVRAKFLYNGYVVQPASEVEDHHYWPMSEVQLVDGASLQLQVTPAGAARYLLPTRPGGAFANIVDCQGKLARDPTACGADYRRMWGNAQMSGLFGFEWMPLTAQSNFTHNFTQTYQNITAFNTTSNTTYISAFDQPVPNPFLVDIASLYNRTSVYGHLGSTQIGCRLMAREMEQVPPVPFPQSCEAVKVATPTAKTGVYIIQPATANGPIYVHCDFDTDGGAWTLLSRFDSDGSQFTTNQYNNYFKNAKWIEGASEGPPLGYKPNWDFGGARVHSQDWRHFLVKDKVYDLRQRCESQNGKVWDAAYSFIYNGHVTQANTNRMQDKSWILTNPRIFADTTAGSMATTPPARSVLRFWLPYVASSMTEDVLCAEGYDKTTCAAVGRAEGTAGIAYHDLATLHPGKPNVGVDYMPYTRIGFDIARTQQDDPTFGLSASPMTCTYAVRAYKGSFLENCQQIHDSQAVGNATAPSGHYLVNSTKLGKPTNLYCDMDTSLAADSFNTTVNTPWTLMAKFSQGNTFFNLTQPDFLSYFYNNLWIEGHAQDPPLSPEPQTEGYHIESLDWRTILTNTSRYQIRQTCTKLPVGTKQVDSMYEFVYPGYVRQRPGVSRYDSVWVLTNHTDLVADTTSISWHRPTDDVTRFVPPFGPERTDPICGIGGYNHTMGQCAGYYGSAGIIGTQADNLDPAFSFLPWSSRDNTDIANVHQDQATYGTSGQAMSCEYYIREVPPQPVMKSCYEHHIRIQGPPTNNTDPGPAHLNGIYLIRPPGHSFDIPVYCDMSTERGGWTLLSKFSQHQDWGMLPDAMWRRSFVDGLWMYGDTVEPPLTPTGEYDDYHVEGLDWRQFITPLVPYRIRQSCTKTDVPWLLGVEHTVGSVTFKNNTELKAQPARTFGHFDLRMDITPNSNFEQPDNIVEDQHVWPAANPFYLNNSDNIQFDSGPDDNPMYWWLPITTLNRTGLIVTGCDGYTVYSAANYYKNGGCYHNTTRKTVPWRELGNTGFTRKEQTTTPTPQAASFLPSTRAEGLRNDLAIIPQHRHIYGMSGDPMVCHYYIRDDDYFPIVTGATNSSAVGSGVTITGVNFGATSNAATAQSLTVTVDGAPCNNPSWLTPTKIYCDAPPGIGPGHDVRVERGGHLSRENHLFGYAPPVISTASFGPAVGGTVTIRGKNFGPYNNPVLINLDGGPCNTPTWVSDTLITCDVVPGTGGGKTAEVIVAGQWNPDAGTNTYFSYARPEISTVSSVFSKTGGVITIVGQHFASADPTPLITVGGSACTTPTWVSDTELTCVQPAGTGGAIPVLVTIDGQVNVPANLGWYFGAVDWTLSPIQYNDFVDTGERIYENVANFNCTDCIAITRFEITYNATYDTYNTPPWRPLDVAPAISITSPSTGDLKYTVKSTVPYDAITPPGQDMIFDIKLFYNSFGKEFQSPDVKYFFVNTDPPPPPIITNAYMENTFSGGQQPPASTSCVGQDFFDLYLVGQYFGKTRLNYTGVSIAGESVDCTRLAETTVKCKPPVDRSRFKTGPIEITTTSGKYSTSTGGSFNGNFIVADTIVTKVTPSQGDALVPRVITLEGRFFQAMTRISFGGVNCNLTNPITDPSDPNFGSWTVTDNKRLCTLDAAQSPRNATIAASRLGLLSSTSCTAESPVFYNFVGPVVTNVSPNFGLTTGYENVTISGHNFGPGKSGLRVTLAGFDCLEIYHESQDRLYCLSRNITKEVRGPTLVTTKAGGEGIRGSSDTDYQYLFPTIAAGYQFAYPHVSSVVPNEGNPLVPNIVTVVGKYFGFNSSDLERVRLERLTPLERECRVLTGTTNTTFEEYIPANFSIRRWTEVYQRGWQNDTAVECEIEPFTTREEVLAALGARVVDVRTYSGGPSLNSLGRFTYTYPPPQVYGVYPRVGSRLGGNNITIVGEYFGEEPPVHGISAYMGKVKCEATYWISHDRIACLIPPESVFEIADLIDLNFTVITVPNEAGRSAMTSSPTKTGFRHVAPERLCIPHCGYNADCQVRLTPPTCDCHKFYAVEPDCLEPAVKVDVRSTLCSEDRHLRGVVAMKLNRKPTAPVTISFGTNVTRDDVRLNHRRPWVFSPYDFNITRWLVAYGVPDPYRDGDTPFYINFTVTSDDPHFDGMSLANITMVNLESRATVEWLEPALMPIEGARVTLRGRNFDEMFRIRVEGFQVELGFGLTAILGPLDDFGRPRPITRNDTNATRAQASQFALGEWTRISDGTPISQLGGRFKNMQFAPPVVTNVETDDDPRGRVNITTVEFEAPWADWNPATGYADLEIVNIRGSYTKVPDILYYTDTCLPPSEYGRPGDCKACPTGAVCPGGNRVWPKAGYWNPSEDSGFARQCDPRSACPGCENALRASDCYANIEDRPGSICSPSFQGEFCADCVEGHVKQFGECTPCPPKSEWIAYLITDLVVWTFLGICVAFVENRENVALIASVYSAAQTVGVVSSMVDPRLPSWALSIWRVFGLFIGDIDFIQTECSLGRSDFETNWYLAMVYNVGLFLPGLFLIFCAKKYVARKLQDEDILLSEERREHYLHRFRYASNIWMSLIYYNLTHRALEAVSCIPMSGQHRTATLLSHQCYVMPHWPVYFLSYLILIFVSIGFPLGQAKRMIANAEILYVDKEFQESYSFLYDSYLLKWRFFYVFDYLSLLSFAMADTILREFSTIRLFVMVIPVSIQLLLTIVLLPLRRWWDNAVTILLKISVTGVAVLMYMNAKGIMPPAASEGMVYGLVASSCLAVLLKICVCFYYLLVVWIPFEPDIPEYRDRKDVLGFEEEEDNAHEHFKDVFQGESQESIDQQNEDLQGMIMQPFLDLSQMFMNVTTNDVGDDYQHGKRHGQSNIVQMMRAREAAASISKHDAQNILGDDILANFDDRPVFTGVGTDDDASSVASMRSVASVGSIGTAGSIASMPSLKEMDTMTEDTRTL